MEGELLSDNRARYKIGRISELMGITSEALRYYEHEGVVVPEKAVESGYRMYSAWDLHILIASRSYSRYNFTLAETVRALDSLKVDEIQELLSIKESELKLEIEDKQRLLEQLRHDQYALEDTIKNLGKFRIEYCPSLVFIATQRSYDILYEQMDLYKQWIAEVPYARSGGVFEAVTGNQLRFGLMIEERNVEGFDNEFLQDATLIPSQKCVTTFFTSGSERELTIEMFTPALRFMEEKGLEMEGDPFARNVLMKRGTNGAYYSWYQGWIPFKGDCEYCCPPSCDLNF